MNKTKPDVWLFLKGMAMGGADVVPGVSGGTIAFITGIYEQLINAIKAFDGTALKYLTSLNFRQFWNHVNGNFLLVLVAGISLSLGTLARVITFLLEIYPIQLWSFFFGLIIISAVIVAREITKWDWRVLLSCAVGIGIAFYITVATPAETPENLWFIFICGALAICAMILPGISGAFILLILGKYEYILNALKSFNLLVILTFVAGCAVGLLSFAKVISWLLKHYYNVTIALLAGFMIGSLNKIWPWKIVVTYRMDRHGIPKPFLENNILPTEYLENTGRDPLILQAILFMIFGIVVVFAIDKIAHLKTKSIIK